jgi:hypothetical protein
MSDWWEEHLEQLKQEQAGKSRDQVKAELSETSEHVFDPDTVTPVQHRWVDRGLKMSCEGAGHPHHQAWKRYSPNQSGHVNSPRILPM